MKLTTISHIMILLPVYKQFGICFEKKIPKILIVYFNRLNLRRRLLRTEIEIKEVCINRRFILKDAIDFGGN
jgi:hypothetical protein